MTSVTVVVDNRPGRQGLTPEWGLALWIEHKGRAILYDTGAGASLMDNLAALDLDPQDLSAVVISHGHFDHIGGLAPLLSARGGAPLAVWCHIGVFDAHLKDEPEGPRDIGPPLGGRAPYEDLGAEFHFVDVYAHPWSGVHLLAPIPRRTSFEWPAPGLVSLLGPALVPDPVNEDLTMVLDTPEGPVAISGCGHAGPVNILTQVQQVMAQPAAWLIGGLHLDLLDPLPRQNIMEHLGGQERLRLALGHCTGDKAMAELAELFEGRLTPLSLGLTLEF